MDVGFIGLGAMGTPMAHNLCDAGLLIAVYNRTSSKTEPFADRGVSVASTPAALAEQVDVVFVMVTADDALRDVLDGPDGVLDGLGPESIVVNTSTVSIEGTRAAASSVRAVDGRFVDAPVSGTVGPAEEGTLTVLAGAQSTLLDEVRPVLDAIGDPIVQCGEVGAGTKTKLFTNLLLGNLMQAYSEALVFGRKHGLSLDHMQDVLESSPVGAPLFEYKAPLLDDRDFEKRFPVDLLLKDLGLVAEAAEQQGVYLPQTSATREAASGVRALGHGDEDMTALIKLLESIAETTVGGEAD
jgi:3-hydroxyisobutyrate dehydrogenase/2-hydroxy-3-oxopropionate reductase